MTLCGRSRIYANGSMIPHRKIITTAYLVAGFYFGYIVIRDFDSILTTQKAFFDLGPDWYANATTIAIGAVPLAFLAIAYMVHRMMKWWFVVIPAAYGTLLASGYLPIALGVYLFWFYAFGDRVKVTPDVGA